jgi:hypothetical protein
VSWGDSLTLYETGVLEFFKESPAFNLIQTFDENLMRKHPAKKLSNVAETPF